MQRKPLLALLLALALLAVAPAFVVACPNCADTVGENDSAAPVGSDKSFVASLPTKDLADSFNYSIYLMLIVPYALLTIGGFVVYRLIKKADARMIENEATPRQP